jgi:hypothetical protein
MYIYPDAIFYVISGQDGNERPHRRILFSRVGVESQVRGMADHSSSDATTTSWQINPALHLNLPLRVALSLETPIWEKRRF